MAFSLKSWFFLACARCSTSKRSFVPGMSTASWEATGVLVEGGVRGGSPGGVRGGAPRRNFELERPFSWIFE